VLARDLVQPGLEFGIRGCLAGGRGGLSSGRERGDQPPQAEGSGAGRDAAQKAAAVCGEVADIEHATSY